MDGAWPVGLAVLLGVAGVLAAVAGVALLRRRFVVVTVRGPSMEPTMRDGDRVLVRRRRAAQLRTGDLVVFAEVDTQLSGIAVGGMTVAGRAEAGPGPSRGPGARKPWSSDGWLVKRAVAVAGDPVPREAGPALATLPDEVVPPDHLVAIGDNGASSYDSRHYGYVTADRLLGVVLRRV
ncbi:S26 family signal peptidase [Plantactinospora sp. B6F1]|uniref:S26 family signal peptidase n=1 Tax=Plantactinospora sp. B6F1 TaxID=3158971 RepID=UPI00102BC293